MILHLPALLAIIVMALVTYLTRISGYLLLTGRCLSPRMQAIMDIVPGCVLVAVIAPDFATGRPADILGLLATILAATRFSLLPTMLCGIITTGLLRAVLG
ncbi:AzlD family protein [Parasaccharibacter sp. TMW 2.1888]|uniref:AzlD family protein n=1 Tax=Parasaccharibacter sp. TMW 2.1888 TaxID=2268025 RepID=UPI002063B262|nr:AzlD family protein [Parasaccharibacter sp. TMW 2.1888]UPO79883.1 AzlD family protein [Parasaccharibacter sp. TMW 2.1888]